MALIDNSAASAKVHSIYDGSRKTRGVNWINNFSQVPPRRQLERLQPV
jgi:hypothetical protein